MNTRSFVHGLAGLLCGALVLPAFAQDDLAAGLAAYDAGNYQQAARLLSDSSLDHDVTALEVLARMAFFGEGQPEDAVRAYDLLSRIVILGDSDVRQSAVQNRRDVAREMTLAEIRTAEQSVVGWVDADMGTANRKNEVAALVAALDDCPSSCLEETVRVFDFGPAAAETIPALESLMVRDPMWIPRQDYAFALMAIGTAAIPSMCRLIRDQKQQRTEGNWNRYAVSVALGEMGPTAVEAEPCLLEVLLDPDLPINEIERMIASDIGEPIDELLTSAKVSAAQGLTRLGGMSAQTRDGLVASQQPGSNPMSRSLSSWVLAIGFGEIGFAVQAASDAFDGQDEGISSLMLRVLTEVSGDDSFAAEAAVLRSRIESLSGSDDPEVAELATGLLEKLDAH